MKSTITYIMFTIICCSNLVTAQAPNFLWAKSAGGTEFDRGYSVSTEASGNVFITGMFESSSITFGTTTLTNANTGLADIFIAKYDANGNLLWAKRVGGTGNEFAKSIVTDADGNVFITGFFTSGTISFGSTNFNSIGNATIFIVKYDSDGNVIWAKSPGNSNNDDAKCISTDVNGNVFLTGSFESPSITFGSVTLTNAGLFNDIFIVKYDTSGNVLWAKSAGGAASDQVRSVSTDIDGNVFITGYFFSPTITFGTTNLTNVGAADIFIVKYDPNGNVLWAKTIGNISHDIGYGISTDKSGNVIISGCFFSPNITFGAITLVKTNNMLIQYDIFIAKYDTSGNVLWAKNSSSVLYGGHGNSVSTDASGNVFMTGSFSSPTITFGATTLTNAGNIGVSDDIFIVKYDVSGNIIWAKVAGGNDDDYGNSVSTDATGNIFITGYFLSPTITFGTTTITNAGNTDIYIAKLDTSMTIGIPEQINYSSSLTIVPNPFTFQATLSFNKEQNNTTIKIVDVLGNEIKSITFSGKQVVIEKGAMKSGIYFVQAIDENKNVANGKIIIQ